MADKKKKKGMFKFFKQVLAEMKKVTWPNKKEIGNYTTVVIAMVTITAIGIGIFYLVFKQLFLALL